MRPEGGDLAQLRGGRRRLLPRVMGKARAVAVVQLVGEPGGRVPDVAVQLDEAGASQLGVAEAAEHRNAVERLEDIDLAAVVVLAGAEALVRVGRAPFHLAG